MTDDLNSTRAAFAASVGCFVETLERVPGDAWDKPGLGEWSIREVAAHVVRMLERAIEYSAQPAPVDTESAAAYYLRAMSTPGVHARITKGARESVGLLGAHPAASARAIGERTLAAMDALDAGASAVTPFGTVGITNYLATRVLEVALHTLDVARAAGITVALPPDALAFTLRLLADIAAARGNGDALALALSGRAPLPGGYNVLE